MSQLLSVVVQTPAHSAIAEILCYQSELSLAPGTLVRVPLGKRETLGVVWDESAAHASALPGVELRPISGVLQGIAPLSANWRRLVGFTASYYQRSLGEVALAALPPQLRDLTPVQVGRRLKRASTGAVGDAAQLAAIQTLTAEQTEVLRRFNNEAGPFLLFGATGSGKTEVYLQAAQELLERDASAQVLVMVPEINLTPQLEARFRERFVGQYGEDSVVSMHSGMTPAQRLKSWLAAHQGQARMVLGTRMAVFASMPALRLILVDEEHDPSYKSQEGARYSARDLAVYRSQLESEGAAAGQGCRVLLGSATPSMESWHHSRADGGRYQRLLMPSRVGASTTSTLPRVRLVDMGQQPKRTVFSPPLLAAMEERIARGEQSMIFLNRRGYAPVLQCGSCDWKSECPHCSAYRVFHKIDRSLRCHHCGFTERVPRACPSCGDLDLVTVGRGTERLEEQLTELLAELRRPDGSPVRIARIDADSTRLKGALQEQLAQVHSGEVDVLVGTQMIAKGHDFRNITLVAALNPDGALFSCDFRAAERLFSLLMQAAGRAGRDATQGQQSEMWIQTMHPKHALFAALKKHDFAGFAAQQLLEREQAAMPPFSFQALVRAEGRSQEVAQGFLQAASAAAADVPDFERVTLYPPVPMSIQRVANVERAQMLVESASRVALQRFLAGWHEVLQATRRQPEGKGLIRWAVDVDPLAI